MYHIFFIHSSVEGHLGCFQVLVITNNSAMNTAEHRPLRYECTLNIAHDYTADTHLVPISLWSMVRDPDGTVHSDRLIILS